MYIKLTTITQARQQRNFILDVSELERIFDLLNIATQLGEIVVNVSYIDRKGELPLPIETIRPPFPVNPFHQLKQQWESVLAPTVVPEVGKIEPAGRQNRYLSTSQQKQLDHYQRVHMEMQRVLETTHIALTDGPRKKRLLDLHQKTIQRCQRLIVKLEASIQLTGRFI